MSVDPRELEVAALSDAGRVREANQDAYGEFEDASGMRLFVVADGMGGHRGGETASRLAVEALGEVVRASGEGPEATITRAFEHANERVLAAAREHRELAGMGTTGVALAVGAEGTAWVAHVGDSRAYRLRDGRIEALTADHSVVGELRRSGLVTEEEAATHPKRNEILRSIGTQAGTKADLAPVSVEPGDRFLLCSDGLTTLVPDEEIATVLARERPDDAARVLVDLANARGGPDNVTVQVVAVPPGGEAAAAPAAAAGAGEARRARRRRIRRLALAAAVVALLLAAALGGLLVRAGLAPGAGGVAPAPAREGEP